VGFFGKTQRTCSREILIVLCIKTGDFCTKSRAFSFFIIHERFFINIIENILKILKVFMLKYERVLLNINFFYFKITIKLSKK